MARTLWILVATALAVAGCGGGGEPRAAADPKPTETATPTPTPDPKPQIHEVAAKWLQAVVENDPKARCDALAPSERRHFARLAGSCEKAMRYTGTPKQQAVGRRIARKSEVGQIVVYKAGYAEIAIADRKDGPYLAYYAIKERGRWWLARKKRTPIVGDPVVVP
jgi:hypothetical protein